MSTKQESTAVNASQRTWVLFAICILALMVQVDYTAVNVGLESMSQAVHSNLTTIQWVLSAYVLAWGAILIPAGRLSDLYGKRRLFLIGNVLFLIGSACAGFAHSAGFLIGSRVIQGAGGALYLPALYTLIFTAYPEQERGKAMGILSAAFAVGMAIGPTLGGILIHWLSWRYIFFINIPLGFAVIGIILATVPKEPRKLLDEKMDMFGAIFIAATFVLLMFGIDNLKTAGVYSSSTMGIFLLAGIMIILLVIWQNRARYPILNLNLFRNRTFVGCVSCYVLLGYNFAAILIIGGLYLQNTLEFSSLETGLIFLAMTIAFGVLSVYGGRLCDRFDKRIPIVSGGVATIIANVLFINLGVDSPVWLITLMFAMAGMGFGLAFPGLNMMMMACVNDDELNSASGTFNMFGCLGNSTGLILSAVSIVHFSKLHLFQLFADAHIQLSELQQQVLIKVISSAHYASIKLDAISQLSPAAIMDKVHLAFVSAMSKSLSIALLFTILSIILGIVLIKEKPKAVSNES